MNTNPNHRGRSSPDERDQQHAKGRSPSADTWPRPSERTQDAGPIPADEPDLPTHVVGEHHTD
jgi:hypothetical protein